MKFLRILVMCARITQIHRIKPPDTFSQIVKTVHVRNNSFTGLSTKSIIANMLVTKLAP